ncbi:uncharacterized protein L201_001484 [Kwoniella dendrophila CBS 6074]|uniref:Uncharacterized protein n=1 Tax=Kwoniella dendrophila CBS 6074 TaxID=1295534 RepID=A0AAX4JP51_9TREE
MNKDEMESQDTYKSTVIFPNLKRVVLFSPLVELYLSNPFSEDFFKERIISLKTCIGLNNKLHIDLDAEGMTREMFGGFMKIIRFNLDPKSLVLKIRPDLFPIQSLYAKQSLYTGINLYIETKNVEEENKLQREVRRTYALLSLHFPNQVTHPVHFHLKDQQLIDVINERLSAYGSNKDKWIKIVKWENEDDWMK